MEQVLELRCILEEGQLVKQLMKGAVIVMLLEVGICITWIARYLFR